jgi:hypothetical protein
MKKLSLLWLGSVLISLVLNGQMYGMKKAPRMKKEFAEEMEKEFAEEIEKLMLGVGGVMESLIDQGKEKEAAEYFKKYFEEHGSPELKKFMKDNSPEGVPFPKSNDTKKESFWKNHGDKVILGTTIVSAAIMGYWSSELEALIIKHKKIILISLALLLFGGIGHYCLKNCKDGGLWKTIKKDAESLKNVTRILTLVLPPATYLAFRSIFKKKEPTIEI